MTPHFTQKAPHAGNRWLLPLLPSILAAVSPIGTSDPTSLTSATEYPVREESGTIQDMTTWKGTPLCIFPLGTTTVEPNIHGTLVPSPVLDLAPHMTSNRIACGTGKTQANAHRQSTNASALPFNGKRQVLTIRTTPPEIGISVRQNTATIIGPVQEVRKPTLSGARRVSQAVPAQSSTVESASLFGAQPFAASDRFRSTLQEPDNESHRMNLTTAQALHGGNCPGGCP